MLRHVVCIQLKDPGRLSEWIESSQVLATTPTVKNFSGYSLLKRDLFHCTLYMEFDNEIDLRAYQEHPIHRQYLNDILARHASEKMVVKPSTTVGKSAGLSGFILEHKVKATRTWEAPAGFP